MLKQLSDAEFAVTFSPPMRRLQAGDAVTAVTDLRNYVSECIAKLGLPTAIEQIEIQHVYRSGDSGFEHVLFFYGVKSTYLVVVLDVKSASVLGHHLLDVDEKYGFSRSPNVESTD